MCIKVKDRVDADPIFCLTRDVVLLSNDRLYIVYRSIPHARH